MKKISDYQKPELKEYSRFGIVATGNSGQGEERSDVHRCNVSSLDENN